jgi:quinol monooxygenase YgiN
MKSLVARFAIKDGNLEEALHIIREFVLQVEEHETRTLLYKVFKEKDSLRFEHLMTFVDEDAQKAHSGSEYCKKFVSLLYPLCESEPVFTELELISESELEHRHVDIGV